MSDDYEWVEVGPNRKRLVRKGPRRDSQGRAFSIVKKDYVNRATSLPRNDPDYPRTDEHGTGLFETRREVEEFKAKVRARGVDLEWDTK